MKNKKQLFYIILIICLIISNITTIVVYNNKQEKLKKKYKEKYTDTVIYDSNSSKKIDSIKEEELRDEILLWKNKYEEVYDKLLETEEKLDKYIEILANKY